MSKDYDINDYVPSILKPRFVKKQTADLSLTQNSIVSCRSLSLKKNNGCLNVRKTLQRIFEPNTKKSSKENSIKNSAKCNNKSSEIVGIENLPDTQNIITSPPQANVRHEKTIEERSIGLSVIQDLTTVHISNESSLLDIDLPKPQYKPAPNNDNITLISLSSATDLDNKSVGNDSESTLRYDLIAENIICVSFGVIDYDKVNVSTKNSTIRNITITCKDNATNVDCEIVESSIISVESDTDANMDKALPNAAKRPDVSVNLEIKKNIESDGIENAKLLILNTSDIEKLSHVIVQPPNYKLVKRQILDRSKFNKSVKRKSVSKNNVKRVRSDNLVQKRIDSYYCRRADVVRTGVGGEDIVRNDGQEQEMSKNQGGDIGKSERGNPKGKKDVESPRSSRLPPRLSPRRASVRPPSETHAPPRQRPDGATSPTSRKNVDSLQYCLPPKTISNKTNISSPKHIPYFKIVAGTHFAVDAFSYGDIPNVEHYFLTHFHSDHYSGLKKGFNKYLFCSKITADLCATRLGINTKCIHVINNDETITIDGVEVTAVDANHCPGAIMLIFSLLNGKSLLHTGDFRASPLMESYPVFWNQDIDTVYLDTTYCNPRYDFPTQEQSLEMALYILRQKKLALEKVGKTFSSVLIVCGTYTIGKEKFFLGMARRVGCSVWACPEKDRILQAVEGRSFSHARPTSCQLHVVPMRDLTHEKLRTYLDSMQGSFNEVVAFKPSGWENGKTSAVEKDNVIIHGIPYSEHSSFSELIRFVNFLKPKQVVPTVDISGGVGSVQKYFPCPLVSKDEPTTNQTKVSDYFSIQGRQPAAAVT